MLNQFTQGQQPLRTCWRPTPCSAQEPLRSSRPASLPRSAAPASNAVDTTRLTVAGATLATQPSAGLLAGPIRSSEEYGNNIVCSSHISSAATREPVTASASPGPATPSQGSRRSISTAASGSGEISQAEAARRHKISLKMRERWRCTTMNLRSTLQTKMKGKEPWNKGRQMSEETRERMRAAKLATKHTHATRTQMSRAHLGLSQTAAKSAKLSSSLTNLPKSQTHREAIATSQRRRLAAHRILHAIESVHRQSDSHGVSTSVRAGTTYIPGPTSGTHKQSRSQVLESFQVLLHEFRTLQQELGPWTAAFQEQHSRKPKLADVERTGIPWLESKYKQYVVMRERVLTETQALRDRLLNAVPDFHQPQQRGELTGGDKQNSNRASPSATVAASRLANAMAYKSAKSAQSTPSPASPPALSTPPKPPTSSLPSIPAPGTTSPPRVRTALMAAAEYRRRKAEETVAAAQSAADSARAPRSKAKRQSAQGLAAAAATPGAALLIKGKKFEGRDEGEARRDMLLAACEVEADAVDHLVAELDLSVQELVKGDAGLVGGAA